MCRKSQLLCRFSASFSQQRIDAQPNALIVNKRRDQQQRYPPLCSHSARGLHRPDESGTIAMPMTCVRSDRTCPRPVAPLAVGKRSAVDDGPSRIRLWRFRSFLRRLFASRVDRRTRNSRFAVASAPQDCVYFCPFGENAVLRLRQDFRVRFRLVPVLRQPSSFLLNPYVAALRQEKGTRQGGQYTTAVTAYWKEYQRDTREVLCPAVGVRKNVSPSINPLNSRWMFIETRR